MLRKIRKNMEKDQFLKVATAQLFSIMYYASPVWLNETLGSSQWKKLRSIHYRILRIATKDFKQRANRRVLDKTYKRATPKMWSQYSTFLLVMKTLRDRSPIYLTTIIMQTYYNERRKPGVAKFYDNSRGKVRKHRICNRLETMAQLPEWFGRDLTNHQIRLLLKDHLDFDFKNDR